MSGSDGSDPPPERDRPPARPPTPPGDAAGRDSLLRPFLEDPGLWPVTAVVVLTTSTLGAALLVLAFGDRNPPAIAAVILAAAMTVFALEPRIRRGRPGLAGLAALLLWGLSGAGALAYLRWMAT